MPTTRTPTWQEIDALIRAKQQPLPSGTTHTAWGIARRYLRETSAGIVLTAHGLAHINGY